MNDRDVLVELQQQHGIRARLEDGCQLPGWAERMIANALRQPDFRATVAAALAELRAKLDSMMFNERHAIPFIAIQKAQKELDATITKLGLADEAQEGKR